MGQISGTFRVRGFPLMLRMNGAQAVNKGVAGLVLSHACFA